MQVAFGSIYSREVEDKIGHAPKAGGIVHGVQKHLSSSLPISLTDDDKLFIGMTTIGLPHSDTERAQFTVPKRITTLTVICEDKLDFLMDPLTTGKHAYTKGENLPDKNAFEQAILNYRITNESKEPKQFFVQANQLGKGREAASLVQPTS